ncbi:MAG: hypothetical protein ACYCVD_02555 [Desulfitobacteriaceae bacterium]
MLEDKSFEPEMLDLATYHTHQDKEAVEEALRRVNGKRNYERGVG